MEFILTKHNAPKQNSSLIRNLIQFEFLKKTDDEKKILLLFHYINLIFNFSSEQIYGKTTESEEDRLTLIKLLKDHNNGFWVKTKLLYENEIIFIDLANFVVNNFIEKEIKILENQININKNNNNKNNINSNTRKTKREEKESKEEDEDEEEEEEEEEDDNKKKNENKNKNKNKKDSPPKKKRKIAK